MKPYPKYKPSGVPWLGDVPEHWEVKKAKYAVTCNDDVLPEDFAADAEISYVEISDVEEGVGIKGWTEVSFKDAPSRARRKVQDGDIIISTVRTYLKAIAPIENPPDNLVVSTGFAVLRPHAMSPRFAKYAFSESGFINTVLVRSTGVSYPAINATDLVRIPIPVPGDEQEAIAAYLDTETARIDALVSEKEKLIDLLKEYRQSVITEAVTKGLNQRTTMKDSGIPWLGKVPEHWDVVKLQRLVDIAEGQVDPEVEPYLSMPLIAPNHIESGTGRLLALETAAEQGAESGKYLCLAGDVVYSKIRPALRKVCVAPTDCLCSADMYPLRAHSGLTNAFLQWFILSEPFSALAVLESDRVAMPKINREALKAVMLAIPPEAEQTAIVTHLDTQTTKIEGLITHVEKEIELLKELRSATITDAVLGRIDLRGHLKKSKQGDKASELQPAL